MAYQLYDYVDERGVNVIREWMEQQEKVQRAAVNQKLDLLRMHGPDLPPKLLSGVTGFGKLRKLKVARGPIQLRLTVCCGPIEGEEAFTLLFGFKEKDFKNIPADAYQQSDDNRKKVTSNPTTRRRPHERIS